MPNTFSSILKNKGKKKKLKLSGAPVIKRAGFKKRG
jgi:hypothetical protein